MNPVLLHSLPILIFTGLLLVLFLQEYLKERIKEWRSKCVTEQVPKEAYSAMREKYLEEINKNENLQYKYQTLFEECTAVRNQYFEEFEKNKKLFVNNKELQKAHQNLFKDLSIVHGKYLEEIEKNRARKNIHQTSDNNCLTTCEQYLNEDKKNETWQDNFQKFCFISCERYLNEVKKNETWQHNFRTLSEDRNTIHRQYLDEVKKNEIWKLDFRTLSAHHAKIHQQYLDEVEKNKKIHQTKPKDYDTIHRQLVLETEENDRLQQKIDELREKIWKLGRQSISKKLNDPIKLENMIYTAIGRLERLEKKKHKQKKSS